MKQLSDLAFFIELAKHNSLSEAALSLQVSSAAVSKRLSRLENRLGVRLMLRSTRRIALTEEGEHYLEQGQVIVHAQEALEKSLAAAQQEPQGLLRVNASLGFGRQKVAQLVAGFARRYPKVEVLLELTDHSMDLIADGFDVNIWFGRPPDSRLVARKVVSNRRILVASPSYLARRGQPLAIKDLTAHDCIVIRQDKQRFNQWGLRSGHQHTTVKVRGPLTTNHGEVAVQWALAGWGILLRSEWDIAEPLQSGALVRVLGDWQGEPADVYAAYTHRKNLSAKVRCFVDFLQEELACPPGIEPGPQPSEG